MKKDIYEYLEEIEIEEAEMEEAEVSEMEKERMKKRLRTEIQKKNGKWGRKAVAAAFATAVLGAGAIGVLNPAYAATLPIVGDIFRFLDGGKTGAYDRYQEHAQPLSMTSTDQGITITIRDAIFDGQAVSYTYEIVSDQELGEILSLDTDTPKIKGYMGGMGGSSQVERVSSNTYVGMDSFVLHEEREHLDFELAVNALNYMIEDDYQELMGSWRFSISLDAVPGIKMQVGQSVETQGIEITLDSVTAAPMSTILRFTQTMPEKYKENPMNAPYLDIEITDNLGNEYASLGMTSNSDGGNGPEYFYMSVAPLAEGATEFIITPSVSLPSGGGGVAIDENGRETVLEWEENPYKEELEGLVFEPIHVNVNMQ